MVSGHMTAILISYILQSSPHRVTLVKTDLDRDSRIGGNSSWDLSEVDFCCPKNKPVEVASFILTLYNPFSNIGVSCYYQTERHTEEDTLQCFFSILL